MFSTKVNLCSLLKPANQSSIFDVKLNLSRAAKSWTIKRETIYHFSSTSSNHSIEPSTTKFSFNFTLRNRKDSSLLSSKIQQQPIRWAQSSSRPKKRSTLNISRTKLEDRFKMEWPKVTLFGDSITRRSTDTENGCWGSMIAYRIGNYFDLDTRGFEGYNTKMALELMPQLFPKSYLDKVELFIPFFGHNDSWEGMLGVPVDQYETNLRSILKYLFDNGLDASKIIMITPTWYYHQDFEEYLKELGFPKCSKTEESCRAYAGALTRVAKENNIELLDFFEISLKNTQLKEMFCDGVHFSRKGAKLLFDNLMPIIEKKIETRYKKPLADIWHAIPIEQHPEIRPILSAFISANRAAGK